MSINSATSRRHALTGSIMLIAALGLMFTDTWPHEYVLLRRDGQRTLF